jgi:hypothetical protein
MGSEDLRRELERHIWFGGSTQRSTFISDTGDGCESYRPIIGVS